YQCAGVVRPILEFGSDSEAIEENANSVTQNEKRTWLLCRVFFLSKLHVLGTTFPENTAQS
ncbi:hypothetical protein OFN63_29200, partial [Escherichia coli]|nr:hypothetical protein [Escherichia coli]